MDTSGLQVTEDDAMDPIGFPTPPESTSSTVKSQKSKQKRKKRKKSKKCKNSDESAPFKFVESFFWKGKKETVYDVKFNRFIRNKNIFATAFTNTIVVYECYDVDNNQPMKETMKKLAEFESNPKEYFYTLGWSYDQNASNGPILAAAGELGVVHIFFISDKRCKLLEGHCKLFTRKSRRTSIINIRFFINQLLQSMN